MAYKRVDIDAAVEVDGYSFEDTDGCIFAVGLCAFNEGVVSIISDGENHFDMYTRDIPMMVKALQAAYEHKA